MGLFGKNKNKDSNRKGLFEREGVPLSVTNIVILVVMTLVLVQALGLILNISSITLGPVFVLVAIGMTAAISVAIFKKIADGDILDSKDIYAILVSATIALILMIFLRDFVPEIFRESMLIMQSAIGL